MKVLVIDPGVAARAPRAEVVSLVDCAGGLQLWDYSPIVGSLSVEDTQHPPVRWCQRWVVGCVDERVVGAALVAWDPHRRQRAPLDIVVDPAVRRVGHGRSLLAAALRVATASRISRLAFKVVRGSAGEAFVAAAGATCRATGWRLILDVAGHLPDISSSRPAHEVIVWAGPCPDGRLPALLALRSELDRRHVPAPATLWRAHEARLAASGYRWWTAAIAEPSGTLMAATELLMSHRAPGIGFVSGTIVARKFRGNHLAAAVKVAALDHAIGSGARLEKLVTFNAAGNDAILTVNRRLGFQPMVELGFWELTQRPG